MTLPARLLLVASLLPLHAAARRRPLALELPASIGEAIAAAAALSALVVDPRPLLVEPAAFGRIVLSERVYLVPIHFYPVKAGLHETVALVIDGRHGMRPLRIEIAGSDIIGGAEGEIALGEHNTLQGTFINTPLMALWEAEETTTWFEMRLPGDRALSSRLRAGAQLWSLPQRALAQGYFQAGAQISWIVGGKKARFDLFAGPGWVSTFSLLPGGGPASWRPGYELSTSLILER